MMKRFCIVVFSFAILSGCSRDVTKTVVVENKLPVSREEVVALSLKDLPGFKEGQRWIVTTEDGKTGLTQLWDANSDSVADNLLFLAKMGPAEKKKFRLTISDDAVTDSGFTYARFVPERTDDYTWENDRVAFRTYGPAAQRMVEEAQKGGTLASGMDCWLKRVDYPIINKWYKKYVDGGTYHKDDGEGYDPYHVGASRGCGGIGIMVDDSLYVSKNFIRYREIAKGPLRTCFELTYAPWKAGTVTIEEVKRITIDPATQLYRIDVYLKPVERIPNCTIGITLHNRLGSVTMDSTKGVFSYWEPMDDSELGTAVVIDPSVILSSTDFRSDKPDRSHIFVAAKPEPVVSYYTGFAWKKAGRIRSLDEWNTYLREFAERLKSPLTIEIE